MKGTTRGGIHYQILPLPQGLGGISFAYPEPEVARRFPNTDEIPHELAHRPKHKQKLKSSK